MRLIVNADDFGYSPGVNRGIIEGFEKGVVRSTTIMANMPAFEDAVNLALETPGLSVGLHFNLTSGPCLTGCCTLTDKRGMFVRGLDYSKTDPRDVRRELGVQMQRLLQRGIIPSHIDSHHHVHAQPVVAEAVSLVARRMRLPVRPCGPFEREGRLLSTAFFGEVSLEKLKGILLSGQDSGAAVMELMCHPGRADEPLIQRSSYSRAREKELALLTDPKLKAWLDAQGITLGSYRDFPLEERID